MKKYLILAPLLLALQGCTPHLGKDILIKVEPKDVVIENSVTELTMTAISFIGVPTDKAPIKLSGYLTVENKWWKSITIKEINYNLLQNDDIIAKGNAKINKEVEIRSDETRRIPLTLKIDTKSLTPSKMIKRLTNKDELIIEGTVTVEVFGKEIKSDFKNKINS